MNQVRYFILYVLFCLWSQTGDLSLYLRVYKRDTRVQGKIVSYTVQTDLEFDLHK